MEDGEPGMGSQGAARGAGVWEQPFQFALFVLKSHPYLLQGNVSISLSPTALHRGLQPHMWGAMAVQNPNNAHNMYPYTCFLRVPSNSRYSSMIPCYLYFSLLSRMNQKHQMLSKNSIRIWPNAIKLLSSKVALQIKTPICPLSHCLKRGWWRVCGDSFFL